MHLGDMVDGLVDLGHDVVAHHRGVGDSHGGGGDGLDLNGLDLDGLDGGDGGGDGGVDDGAVSVGDSGGGVDNGGNSLADGINKAVLVHVLGEALQGDGAEAAVGGDEVAEGSGQRTGGQAGVQVGLGEEQLGVSLGAGSGQRLTPS